MACGGNACGGLQAGMRRGAAPRRPCCRGPSVAATRRDCQGSPPEPGPLSSRLTARDLELTCQSISPFAGQPPHCPSTHQPLDCEKSEDVCECEPECQISAFRSEIEKEKLGMRWSVTQRTVSSLRAASQRRCLPSEGGDGETKRS